MNYEILLYVYLFGWVVVGIASIDKFTLLDVFWSFIASLLWPVLLPASVVRKLLS